MTTKDIDTVIAANIHDAHFTGGVGEEIITSVEKRLEVTFPKTYKWFLRNYGYGSMWSFEVLGVGLLNSPIVAKVTERYRSLGLPTRFVVVEDSGEFVSCLDLTANSETDCPVVRWFRESQTTRVLADSFLQFLYDEMQEAQDNS